MNRLAYHKISFLLFALSISVIKTAAQEKRQDQLIEHLLRAQSPFLDTILARKDELKVQILYTEIERGKKGKVKFTEHRYNVQDSNYFYPASTVKLPVAILALQKLNELNIKGLDRNTTMITGMNGDRQTEVCNDPSASDGRPTIAHYIKKILLVSDNDAYNRLYEFLGQEYINNTLHKMGYTNVQIIHRLEVNLTEEENRHTNPVQFFDSSGKLLYDKPTERSQLPYALRNTKMGKGFYRAGQLINEPFDFSKKNRFTLDELHSIVRSIIFPAAVPAKMRFNLTEADYQFLQKYMSMTPGESRSPVYPAPGYWDTYVKFIYFGAEKVKPEPHIRIFNKPGDAYGFLIDGAYVVDYENKVEFLLSAVIHCNNDSIYNDDKYEYKTVGLPFMKQLGRIIYNYERTKVRKGNTVFFPQMINYTD
ncbi:MAG: serine hydrolase [Chitinophagaceae bacterium]|nr:serine hydrolase [Chitinophagaceae bacterium]